MIARKAITPAMKVSCLLFRWFTPCALCGNRIQPADAVEWDHVHALCHGGPHEYQNIRPVHAACHKRKTSRDVKDNAKVKRLRGELKPKRKVKIPGRKLQSRPFQQGKTKP